MYTFHEHMPDTVLRRLEAYRMLRNAAEHILRKPVAEVSDHQAYSWLLRRAIDIKDGLDLHWSEYRENLIK